MVSEDYSCIKEVTKVVNLSLPSMYNTNEISGICDTLESWKRQYIKQLHGIVVGYKNVSLTSKRGYIKVDTPVIYCSVKATFELFFPTIGSIIKGKVNRISQDHISCLVHDTINVTVHRTPDTTSDISKFIILDQEILFQITRINFKSKFIHVKGKITEECITLMKETGMLSDNIEICDDNILTCASPDFSGRKNNHIIYNDDARETGDISTDTSSQTSHKKKKKHKKSKENFSMSPSLFSESLENVIDQVELTQSSDKSKKRKHKRSDLASPTFTSEGETEYLYPKKKTEEFINPNINHIELTKTSDDTRKRKRKKSDIDITSSDTASENITEPIHPKKKIKTETFNSVNDASPTTDSPNAAVKIEVISPVKKKKHKKSKSNLEIPSSSSDLMPETEMSEKDYSSFQHMSPEKKTPNSHIKSEEGILTSPDLFDEPSSKVNNEKELVKSKKKKKKDNASDKKKSHKKKKSKKDSKKDKKKIKVISSKKKLHGLKAKLKKKKNKDKKSKETKKNKSKSSKSKNVPE